jgi:tetratricopeptide (TPR) repeat protein
LKKQYWAVRKIIFLLIPVFFASGCAGLRISGPEAAMTWFNLGKAYSDVQNWEQAAAAYMKAMEYDRTLLKAGFNLALVYLYSGKYSDAEKVLQDLYLKDRENLKILNTLAYLDYLENRISGALGYYDRVLQLSPLDANALYNSGKILVADKNYTEGLMRLEKLYNADPADSDVLKTLAFSAVEAGEKNKAKNWLFLLEEKATADERVFIELGRLNSEDAFYGTALEYYDKALKLKSTDSAALFEKAYIILVYIQDADRGLSVLEEALKAGYKDADGIKKLLSKQEPAAVQKINELTKKYIKSQM